MQVRGLSLLVRFSSRHANAKRALETWVKVVSEATWTTPHEVKARFSSADFLTANRAIFNIKGNHYRLLTEIDYVHGIVAIEWIGTHAEYDKQDFR